MIPNKQGVHYRTPCLWFATCRSGREAEVEARNIVLQGQNFGALALDALRLRHMVNDFDHGTEMELLEVGEVGDAHRLVVHQDTALDELFGSAAQAGRFGSGECDGSCRVHDDGSRGSGGGSVGIGGGCGCRSGLLGSCGLLATGLGGVLAGHGSFPFAMVDGFTTVLLLNREAVTAVGFLCSEVSLPLLICLSTRFCCLRIAI
jgi:hypothetical protein